MYLIGVSLMTIGSLAFDCFDYEQKKMPIVLKILFGLSILVGFILMVKWIFMI